MTTTTAAPQSTAPEKKTRVKHSLAERLASMKAETFKEFKKAHEEEGAAITAEVARRKSEAESL